MGSYILIRSGLKKDGDGGLLSFDDSCKLRELYPFCGVIDLHINRMSYAEYGDVSMSGLSDLVRKTDNPGLAFISSISGENHIKDEDLLKKDLLEKLTDSEGDNLFFREDYSTEAVADAVGSEYFRRRKYLFEEVKRVHKLYDLKKTWKAEKKTKSLNQTKEIGLNKSVASEKLAEIYLKQGLKNKAIEMYNQLILDNPKKSDYFAQILKKIN